MKKSGFIFLAIVVVLALSLTITWLVFASSASQLASEDQPILDMKLNQEGEAYEVNQDEFGHLWISDYGAGEIWQVNPAGGVYTIYHGISAPSDARSDGNGTVWWGDAGSNHLGRLSTTSLDMTLWEVPGVDGLYGTQIDQDGRFWATGFYDPLLFSFELQSTQLCTYTIPGIYSSDYLESNEQGIWLASEYGNIIFTLDPDAGIYTQWHLPETGYPVGLALDSSGNLWWADSVLGHMAFLEPQLEHLTTYTLPLGGVPGMIALSGNEVWFTDDVNKKVGKLDTETAIGQTTVVTSTTVPVTPTCNILGPGITSQVVHTTDLITYTRNSYTDVYDSNGWVVYTLPEDGIPWGIAADEINTWVVDYGRRVLSWLTFGVEEAKIYLPIIMR